MNEPHPTPSVTLSAPEGAITPYALSSLTGARVLVLAPHPDDEVIGCGGALRLHTLAGDAVKVLVLTDGRYGREPGVEEAALTRQRQAESRASAGVLGVRDIEFWAFPDRALGQESEAAARLRGVLGAYRPDLVYVPSPLEHHPDHRAAAELLWHAVGQLSRQARVAFYEIAQPMAVNTLVDISGVVADKKRAVEQHQSQLALVPYGDLIHGLNRYRSYTVSLQTAAAEGYFVTPAVHLMDESIGAFHTWMINPMFWKEVRGEPRVSFVVRTLNRPRLLREALGSIALQAGASIEAVVVNDGGAPVESVVDEFRACFPVILINHPATRGRAAAANAGLRACRGRYVNFLDDDDLLLSGHMAKLVDFLDASGEQVAYSDVTTLKPAGDAAHPIDAMCACNFDPIYLRLQNYLPIHSVMFRRAVLEKVGYFDETFEACEDWDFWIRLSEHYRFHHQPGVTACYRVSWVHDHNWRLANGRIYHKHLRPGELEEHAHLLVARCRRLQQMLEAEAAAAHRARQTLLTMQQTLVWRTASAITRRLPQRWLHALRSLLVKSK